MELVLSNVLIYLILFGIPLDTHRFFRSLEALLIPQPRKKKRCSAIEQMSSKSREKTEKLARELSTLSCFPSPWCSRVLGTVYEHDGNDCRRSINQRQRARSRSRKLPTKHMPARDSPGDVLPLLSVRESTSWTWSGRLVPRKIARRVTHLASCHRAHTHTFPRTLTRSTSPWCTPPALTRTRSPPCVRESKREPERRSQRVRQRARDTEGRQIHGSLEFTRHTT